MTFSPIRSGTWTGTRSAGTSEGAPGVHADDRLLGQRGRPDRQLRQAADRLRAPPASPLREEYAPDDEVELIIRDLDDDHMLKIMARENLEEWGTSAAVEHETVRAVVEAYAKGQVHLSALDPKTHNNQLRYAPSFVMGDSPYPGTDYPYTARQVAEFLGWLEPSGDPQRKVYDGLSALEFIEEGILNESDFTGLSTKQARAVVEQARTAKREREVQARLAEQAAEQQRKAAEEAERQRARAEEERKRREEQAGRAREEAERQRRLDQAEEAARRARAAEEARRQAEERQHAATARAAQERERGRQQASTVGRHVSREISSGRRGYQQAKDIAHEVRDKREAPPPHIDEYAFKLAAKLNRILEGDYDDRAKELDVLVRFQSNMSANSLKELSAVLQGIADRAQKYRDKLLTPARQQQDEGQVVEGAVVYEHLGRAEIGQ